MKPYLIFSGIIMSMTFSCDDFNCIDGDGNIETERRRLSGFDGIENSTEFNVIYTRSDTSGISLLADHNILSAIVTEVSGNALLIRTSPGSACFRYTVRPVIEVSSPDLNSIFVSGSGDFHASFMEGSEVSVKLTGSGNIVADSIRAGDFSVLLSGSGNISLHDTECTNSDVLISGSGNIGLEGTCDESSLKISGSGNLHAEDFPAGSVTITISGSGNIYTNVLDIITGVISGSGDVHVTGDPDINVTVTGSGRVIKE